MVAVSTVPQPHEAHTEGTLEQRQVIAPTTLTYSQVIQGVHQPPLAPSPASTESLLGHTLEDFALSPLGPTHTHQMATPSLGYLDRDPATPPPDLFLRLSDLLKRGLASMAAQITRDIKSDFQNLGSRMEAIESKLDFTVSRNNQNSDRSLTRPYPELTIWKIGPEDTTSEYVVCLKMSRM